MTAVEKWDVICIGSGITSLAFAAEILRLYPHLKVLILEKHSVVGGYASEFVRPKIGSRFDCSLHKLSGMGIDGNLRRTLAEMGADSGLELRFEEDLFEASLADRRFIVAGNPDQAMRELIASFPHEEQGIRGFFSDVAIHGRNLYMQFRTMLGEFNPDMAQLRYAHKHLRPLSTLQGIRRHVSDPVLIELLAMPIQYIGSFPEEVSYPYFLHIVYACHNMQCAYVKGGSQHLSNTLVRLIESRGGMVMLNARVEQVLLDDDRRAAIGVRTRAQSFFGNHVVVNASPEYALNQLMAEYSALDDVRGVVDKLLPANATTTIYLTTDVPPEDVGLTAAETWIISERIDELVELRKQARSDPGNAALNESAYWHHSTIEVTNYHRLDSTGGNVVIVNTLDDIRQWPQRKTPEYRNKKKQALEVLMERLYRHKPELRGHVTYTEVSTPRTYLRYTNNTGGSGYGARVTMEQSGHGFHHRFPVSNMTFMSAWIAGSGYEAGIGYAALKAKGFRHVYACA
jgi:all-trans-retinol 13,14-reductase